MEIVLKANDRELTGKKVRRLRREGWVPAIVFGRDIQPTNVQVLRADMVDVYKRAGTSTMIGVVLEHEAEPQPAFIREVQRDTVSLEILHVDLELVDLTKPITAHVPITLVGDSPVVEQGQGVVTRSLEEVIVHCLPTDVPSRFEVDVSILTDLSHNIYVGDLPVSDKVEIMTDPDTIVVYVTPVRRAVVEEEVEVAVPGELEEEVEEAAEEEEAASEE